MVEMAHFTNPDAESLDRVAYLIGMPIAHSISPYLHHTIYSSIGKRWGQVLCETNDLPGTLRDVKANPKFMGTGVTMPYKVAVMPYLDELTPEARAIGAINTIFIKVDDSGRTRYWGTNTDCIGIRDAFLYNVADTATFRGRPGLVIGGGGTCRAAVYALRNFLGCSPIYIINRDKDEVDAVLKECKARGIGNDVLHVATVAQAESLSSPAAIVGAVPDFAPVTEDEKTARQVLTSFLRAEERGALLEMCYHPSPITEISELAKSMGWQVIVGTEAMVGQGLEQARLWTGIEIGEPLRQKASEAVRQALAHRHHL